jgi:hypothetical protein
MTWRTCKPRATLTKSMAEEYEIYQEVARTDGKEKEKEEKNEKREQPKPKIVSKHVSDRGLDRFRLKLPRRLQKIVLIIDPAISS